MTTYMKNVLEQLKNEANQIILTGAPGTGKTHFAMQVANGEFCKGEDKGKEVQKGGVIDGKHYGFVQFHPSYDYTDFVEGIRPVQVESEGSGAKVLQFVKLDGIFKAFCRKVVEKNKETLETEHGRKKMEEAIEKAEKEEKEEEKIKEAYEKGKDGAGKFYFIIDEINRADLSKVFGELMFGLESSKRGVRFDTQYQNLPTYTPDGEKIKEDEDVFADGFFIPKNVVIIGTMNDIDRSVESMDFAMRRRFIFEEVEVTEDALKEAFKSMVKNNGGKFEESLSKEMDKLAGMVARFNKEMVEFNDFGLNSQYAISWGQFAEILKTAANKSAETTAETIFDECFENKLKPLLREYLRGEKEDEIKKFIDKCEAAAKKSESASAEQENLAEPSTTKGSATNDEE